MSSSEAIDPTKAPSMVIPSENAADPAALGDASLSGQVLAGSNDIVKQVPLDSNKTAEQPSVSGNHMTDEAVITSGRSNVQQSKEADPERVDKKAAAEANQPIISKTAENKENTGGSKEVSKAEDNSGSDLQTGEFQHNTDGGEGSSAATPQENTTGQMAVLAECREGVATSDKAIGNAEKAVTPYAQRRNYSGKKKGSHRGRGNDSTFIVITPVRKDYKHICHFVGCTGGLNTDVGLNYHVRFHHGQCIMCGTECHTFADVLAHERAVHGKVNPITCLCGFVFASGSAADVCAHIESDQCEACSAHTLLHYFNAVDPTPFMLPPYGGELYTNFCGLMDHISMIAQHSGTGFYPCYGDGETFGSLNALVSHLGGPAYNYRGVVHYCEEHDETWPSPSMMVRHFEVYHSDVKFKELPSLLNTANRQLKVKKDHSSGNKRANKKGKKFPWYKGGKATTQPGPQIRSDNNDDISHKPPRMPSYASVLASTKVPAVFREESRDSEFDNSGQSPTEKPTEMANTTDSEATKDETEGGKAKASNLEIGNKAERTIGARSDQIEENKGAANETTSARANRGYAPKDAVSVYGSQDARNHSPIRRAGGRNIRSARVIMPKAMPPVYPPTQQQQQHHQSAYQSHYGGQQFSNQYYGGQYYGAQNFDAQNYHGQQYIEQYPIDQYPAHIGYGAPALGTMNYIPPVDFSLYNNATMQNYAQTPSQVFNPPLSFEDTYLNIYETEELNAGVEPFSWQLEPYVKYLNEDPGSTTPAKPAAATAHISATTPSPNKGILKKPTALFVADSPSANVGNASSASDSNFPPGASGGSHSKKRVQFEIASEGEDSAEDYDSADGDEIEIDIQALIEEVLAEDAPRMDENRPEDSDDSADDTADVEGAQTMQDSAAEVAGVPAEESHDAQAACFNNTESAETADETT